MPLMWQPDSELTTSAQAVAELKALGLTPVLLSGDRRETAERVAAEVGIERVLAEVLPGARHRAPEEKPGAFVAAVRRFLASLEPAEVAR